MTFGSPGTPGFYVWAQHDPEKNKKILFFILFYKSKGFYHIMILLLYLTCKLI